MNNGYRGRKTKHLREIEDASFGIPLTWVGHEAFFGNVKYMTFLMVSLSAIRNTHRVGDFLDFLDFLVNRHNHNIKVLTSQYFYSNLAGEGW